MRRTLPVALLLILSIVSCGDDTPTVPGTAVVTLDVFSGLPNPTWTLTDDQATEFTSRWQRLPATSPVDYPGVLGYRGLIVGLADGTQIWVSGGVTLGEGTARADPGRTLEHWLLETGRGSVDPTLLGSILTGIEAG